MWHLFMHLLIDSFFNFNFLLLFNYSCVAFLPIPPPHPSQTPVPSPQFCPCVLYSSSCNPLSSLSPPHSRLSIVRSFLTSMSLVIFCFLFFLFIIFQLKVRSYGICPSPSGLLHFNSSLEILFSIGRQEFKRKNKIY